MNLPDMASLAVTGITLSLLPDSQSCELGGLLPLARGHTVPCRDGQSFQSTAKEHKSLTSLKLLLVGCLAVVTRKATLHSS